MDEALFHKFTQHSDLQAELLGTGDAELIEVRSLYVCVFHAVNFTNGCAGFRQGCVLGRRS